MRLLTIATALTLCVTFAGEDRQAKRKARVDEAAVTAIDRLFAERPRSARSASA